MRTSTSVYNSASVLILLSNVRLFSKLCILSEKVDHVNFWDEFSDKLRINI